MKTKYKLLLILGILSLVLFSLFKVLTFLFNLNPRMLTGTAPRYLSLKLYGDIFESPRRDSYRDVLFPSRSNILKYIWGLQKAKYDDSISGIILQPQSLQIGWADVEELRDALADFRLSGKPVFAFLEFTSTRDYYLASISDKIYLAPTGTVSLTGLFAETTFLKDILNKLGIKADFLSIGKYKTAPNTYTHNKMPAPQFKMVNQLLDDFYSHIVRNIAGSRGWTCAKAQSLIDDGPYYAGKALQMKIVDSLLYRDELADLLGNATNEFSGIDFNNYVRGFENFTHTPFKQKIALILAKGTITSGGSGHSHLYGEMVGARTINRYIRLAKDDASIRAIVLRIDSPGGSGLASDLIWREISLARAHKPVVVSMGNLAASGGYYLAMAADTIVASPTTITGSIGVYAGKFNFQGFYDKLGINKEIVQRGKHATIYHDNRNFNPEERQIISESLQSFYQNFVSKAAAGRRMSYAEMERLAQGQVWSGLRAQQIGLVDTLGSLTTALKLAKKIARFPEKQGIGIVVYPAVKSLLERIRDDYSQILALSTLFLQFSDNLQNQHIFTNGEMLTLMLHQISIH